MAYFRSSFISYLSRSAGIGRQAGLRGQCPLGREGSSPSCGKIKINND